MKVFSFLLLATLGFFSTANAQGLASVEDISFRLSNESPRPGETIIVTAESFTTDLNSSNITWTVNGATFQKGIGLTSVQIVAPALGKQTKISVSAITSDGRQIGGSTVLGSGSVDLILETDGYTPPFFEGKFPIVYQNTYKIIAIPNLANSSGKLYDPATLVYEWNKDSNNVAEQSGYGKQVFKWKDEIVPRQRIVKVRVSTRDGSASAEKSIIIQAGNPQIIFYRDDPLYGPIYNSALDSLVGLGKSGEMSVLAVPFGFNKPANGVGSLSFNWLVNMVKQTALETSQSITLRAPGNAAGSSDISLDIKNNNEILQGSKNGFTVTFTKGEQEVAAQNSNGI